MPIYNIQQLAFTELNFNYLSLPLYIKNNQYKGIQEHVLFLSLEQRITQLIIVVSISTLLYCIGLYGKCDKDHSYSLLSDFHCVDEILAIKIPMSNKIIVNGISMII
ncbi:hypothetical protein pb186bvf_012279 [Paramecium bursaria]